MQTSVLNKNLLVVAKLATMVSETENTVGFFK